MTGEVSLEREFYEGFDPSKVDFLIDEYLKKPESFNNETLIGEGYHFKSWKLNSSRGIDFVLKIATSQFWTDRKEKGVKEWVQNLNELKDSNTSFIPPFEIFYKQKVCALVMPFGIKSPRDPEKNKIIQETLNKKGYEIRDVIQIAKLNEVEFIYDLSDLYKSMIS